MCRFIETIRFETGIAHGLKWHQERLQRTLSDHQASTCIDLKEVVNALDLPKNTCTRIRIEYNTDGIISIKVFPYTQKKLRLVELVEIGDIVYTYKYADRKWIHDLVEGADADEIIMIQEGLITDASIANIAFYDGSRWWTPDSPLLKGTQRAALLYSGIISEKQIHAGDLNQFSSFRLINAMLPWEKTNTYDISIIIGADACQ